MLLKQTIHKSRSLVKKTIRNLKCFFFGRYQKLPKSFSFNSFSLSKKLKNCKADQIYTELYEEWEAQLDEIGRREKAEEVPMKEEEEKGDALGSKKEAVSKEKRRTGGDSRRQGNGKKSSPKETGQVLAQRMKELEMVDSGDMEQALDIEEAIHYYSRLKSPVYLDIVDKFFVDMYTELSVPHNPSSARFNKNSTARITNSKRRLGSFRL